MSVPCPSCGCATPDGTLCVDDTIALDTMLAAAPQLIDQLEVAISKQAKISSGGKAGKGTAHLKDPVNWGAVAVRDALLVEVAYVGEDVAWVRSHPQAGEMLAKFGRAIKDAYRAIDRMQDRQYLGRCGMYDEGNENARCQAELWARPLAGEVRCPVCKHAHNVARRRVDLLDMAKDMLVTVKEASRYMGEVGHIHVGQERISAYLRWNRIGYAPGTETFRLGDLIRVVLSDSEKRSA